MRKLLYLLICMIIFLFFFPGCGDDAVTVTPTPTPGSGSYNITGLVTNPSGTKVVENALCFLENTDGTGYRATVTSDPNGAYTFANIPGGNYKIRITKDNYVTFNCYFNLHNNSTQSSVLVTPQDWQASYGTSYPYDPNITYIGVYVDVDGTGKHENNAYVSVSLNSGKEGKGGDYKQVGYMKDDGTIDWNANHTYGKGIAVFYDVASNKTYNITGQKTTGGYTFSTIQNATTTKGEVVSYVMQGNKIDPNNVPVKMSDYSFLTQGYNNDGTFKNNTVVSDSDQTVTHTYGTVTYNRKKLSSGSTIKFNGTDYTVYSSVPNYMTISQGYKNENINSGQTTKYEPNTSIYSGEKIWLVDSKYYIPYISGVTENVAWTVDAYKDNKTYTTTAEHKLQNGWAFDPGKYKAAIVWQNLQPNGGKPQGAEPTKVLKLNPDDHLLDTIKANYGPNTISTIINSDYPYINPVAWLTEGAFIPYQPMPGFQVNLLRRNTPWGTWNLLNNTCGLFVRKDGNVEIPMADVNQPVPLVIQTWTDQMFTMLNLTKSPIPATNNLFPGDEKYYIGNTYLPGSAGVINKWIHYPHMYYPQETSRIDERDADGWLGYKGDKQEDVMAWNDAGGDQGGQGRKPYMLGAAQYTNPSNQLLEYKLRFEHSNTFWYNRDQNDASNTDKLYKSTLYLDGGSGTYINICSIWWTWTKNTGFSAQNGTYKWASDTGGCWVGHCSWNNDPNTTPLPSGWIYPPKDPNAPATAVKALSGPNGANISLTCARADIPDSTNPQAISWVDPGTFADNDPNGKSPVYKYTMTTIARDTNTKFLIVLEDN